MSKPNGRRLKLTEMRAQAHEAMKIEPGYELEMDDGSVFNVPSPLMIDDDQQGALEAAGTSSVKMAKAILGADDHELFIAAGGHSNDVVMAWRLMREELEEGPTPPR